MKGLIKFLSIAFIMTCGFSINFCVEAANVNNQQIVVKKNPNYQNDRPHSPSNQMISIEYDSANHLLMFSTNTNIESISATFWNLSTGDVYSFDVDFSDPIVYQDLAGGEYEIVCISDDGQEFSGYFTIN